jgi:predicted O-methyltransferase YrrM
VQTDGVVRPRLVEVREALTAAGASSRVVLQHARARYSTDFLSWTFRAEFRQVWRTAHWVPGWFHEGSAALLYGVMRERPPHTVVEIGSYLGRSTVFFGLSMLRLNPHGRVIAIDPHTGDRQQLEGLDADSLPSLELFRQHCRAARIDHLVDARVMTSRQAAREWSGPVDLLFVDGWHSYDAVIADGEAWLPHLSSGGVVVFDDYAAYDEVGRAVRDLAARGRFHLWGSVFGQAVGGADPTPPPFARRALRLGDGGGGRGLRSRLGGTASRRR